jgi:hypothetical protein
MLRELKTNHYKDKKPNKVISLKHIAKIKDKEPSPISTEISIASVTEAFLSIDI